MIFGDVFSDIRRRRRIPLRLFEERARISSSYIHDIERGNVLPSPEKLEAIVSVLRQVAQEQRSDPDSDARELTRARDWTIYTQRLGVDPRLAEVFVALGDLDSDAREEIRGPLLEAIAFFGGLEKPMRRGMTAVLASTLRAIETRDPQGQMDLLEDLREVLEPSKGQRRPPSRSLGPSQSKKSKTTGPSANRRRLQHVSR